MPLECRVTCGLSDASLKAVRIRLKVSSVPSDKQKSRPPDPPGRPKDWQDQIKADLAAQLEAGGTLYGIRSDGAFIARTKDGDRIIKWSRRRTS